MIRKKVHKRCKNFSKTFSSICSHGEAESRWEGLLTFFGHPAENFPLDIQKKTTFRFSKTFSPESFHWNWESSFDNSATFLRELVKKIAQCPKMNKLWNKTVFLEILPWTRRMQLPSKNSTRSRKLPAHCLKMIRKFFYFPKQFFFKMFL